MCTASIKLRCQVSPRNKTYLHDVPVSLLTVSLTEFGTTTQLNWLAIDIEYDDHCEKDWVKVYDPSNNEVYGV